MHLFIHFGNKREVSVESSLAEQPVRQLSRHPQAKIRTETPYIEGLI